ncbi:MAG: ubiquitin-like small modifier protein 1 [Acidimicrobiia bacterium]
MTVTVRLPAPLRPVSGGRSTVDVEVKGGADVAALLDRLGESHPALERRLRDEQGRLRPHVNVFVGPDNIRDLAHLGTPLPDGAEVTILPAVSGG